MNDIENSNIGNTVISKNIAKLEDTDIRKLIARNTFKAPPASKTYSQDMVLLANKLTGEIIEIGAKYFATQNEISVNAYLKVFSDFETGNIVELHINGVSSLTDNGQAVITDSINAFNKIIKDGILKN